MTKEKNQTEALVNKYASIDLQTVSDEELDKMIVEIGRLKNEYGDRKLRDLLLSCESERYSRHDGEELTLTEEEKEKIEKVNSMLEAFAKNIYQDTLDTAQSIKKKMDEENQKDGYAELIAKIYPSKFDEKLNNYGDDGNGSMGLLEVLMPIDIMLKMFCNLEFYVEPGQEIETPDLEMILPRVKYNNAIELVYPLALMVNNLYVTIKDIIGIKGFDFYLSKKG